MPPVVRHLVLDNEAVHALLSTKRNDQKRAHVIVALAAANGQRRVPTAVRVEAGWDRKAAGAANANRLLDRAADASLDGASADRAVQLRALVPKASVVDAAVAVAAEQAAAAGGVVEVLTSDRPDLEALCAHGPGKVHVKTL